MRFQVSVAHSLRFLELHPFNYRWCVLVTRYLEIHTTAEHSRVKYHCNTSAERILGISRPAFVAFATCKSLTSTFSSGNPFLNPFLQFLREKVSDLGCIRSILGIVRIAVEIQVFVWVGISNYWIGKKLVQICLELLSFRNFKPSIVNEHIWRSEQPEKSHHILPS